jgi:biopolymer transport protein ExbB/TolQ
MEPAPTSPKPNPAPGGGRLLFKRSPTGHPAPPASGARPVVVSLSWEHEDIENRWGLFKGGRFTSVNKLLSFILAAGISALFLWLMQWLYRGDSSLHHIGEMFVRPGNLYATGPATLFFFWGVVISLVKIPKLRLQRRALELAAVPQHREFVLNEATAKTVLDRVRSLVDDTRYFILLNRIDRALSNLHNIGGVSDVSTILKAQSENDENQVASSYAMIHAMIWAIPVLGFVGTVLGLSIAIQKFTGALTGTTDINQIKDHLKEVTAGLSTAFETTLVGLAFALLLHLLSDLVQQKETDFLDECNEYCQAHVISKLRVRSKEGNPE